VKVEREESQIFCRAIRLEGLKGIRNKVGIVVRKDGDQFILITPILNKL